MAKNIDPKLKKIGDFLKPDNPSFFSIPEYQRAYSWGTAQCDKLWQDIIGFIESDGSDPYFFGTIIVNCLENDRVLSLIDGQQRTTTFLLLLKALLTRLIKAVEDTSRDSDSESLNEGLKAKRNKVMKILYKIEDEDISDVLKDFNRVNDVLILQNKSNNELHKDEISKILSAVDFDSTERVVKKIPYKQKDNKYTNYFRNFKFFYNKFQGLDSSEINIFARVFLEKCEVIEIRSWNVEQAITMFNSLNSDGMPLLDADIISAQLYANSENDRENFNAQWELLLGNVMLLESHKIANIDAILMQFMYITRARLKEYVSDRGSINVTTPGLRRYYAEINDDILKKPLLLCNELNKIAGIWLKIKDYTIVKLLLKFNENVKLYLAGYLSRFSVDEINEPIVARICDSLVRLFAILELVDTGYSSSKFKTFLFGEMIKLVDKSVHIEEIENDFNQHIASTWTKSEIQNEVMEYEKNILVFLNEYLFTKSKGIEYILADKCDIEHIMPSSGRETAQIRMDAGIADNNEFLGLVNRLGNKILLEERINRAIGNEWFRSKVEASVTDKCGYKDSQYAIATSLVEKYRNTSKPYWRKDDIIATTEKIAGRIADFVCTEPSQ